MTIDTSTAIDRAQLSEAKNCPYTPTMNAKGTKTSTVVNVDPTTAPVISPEAASIAPPGFALDESECKCLAMFSTTTTVSSMMRPMATARPPSDIRFNVSPIQYMKRNV